VASDADGLRDSVRDGETGLLFPYGDTDTLAERVVRILTDSRLRERFEASARAWASSFTWERCAAENMELVDGIVQGGLLHANGTDGSGSAA
jgi:glycosyltransferase involved in cell wall biosynthesis